MSARCPKCGSEQIVNDECLKCGVLVSKAHITTSTSMKPISYVAPETTGAVPELKNVAGPSWRPVVSDHIRSIPVEEKKSSIEKKIFLAVLTVLILGGAYQAYRMLIHKASAYGGFYRNNVYYFQMHLPEKGWSHFQPGDLKSKEFKDAHDAFYRGDDSDNPEITMLIWSEGLSKIVPTHFDEETSRRTLNSIEKEVQKRIEKAGLQCEITDSGPKKIGGNDGFVVRAQVIRDQLAMKTVIYCGFNETRAYTIQFLGTEEKMTGVEPEIEKIINSFSYDISII